MRQALEALPPRLWGRLRGDRGSPKPERKISTRPFPARDRTGLEKARAFRRAGARPAAPDVPKNRRLVHDGKIEIDPMITHVPQAGGDQTRASI